MLRALRSLPVALGILATCPCQCGSSGQASAGPTEPAPTKREATYAVRHVSCHGCAEKIETGLAGQAGIERTTVDVKAGRVKVSFDASRTDAETIRKAIETLGYPARLVDDGSRT